ncbi:hypothetical protein [Candidatus Poriferisodalis sp.]|uniref:hypothetical protein n=1 Tax=Candidatus Poriferisodalis sp. TaxID=3101277 RepID=UPI003B5AFAE1
MTQLLTEEVRATLGTSVTYVAPEQLSRASIRYFALAIGADPERWRDEAPPTLICETAQLTGRSAPDGNSYLGHTWELPLPRPCAMFRGGNDYKFFRPARFDDVIRTSWTLVDATERRDRAGDPLLFVTAEAAYTASDDLLATNAETMIFRPLGSAQPEGAASDAEATASGSEPEASAPHTEQLTSAGDPEASAPHTEQLTSAGDPEASAPHTEQLTSAGEPEASASHARRLAPGEWPHVGTEIPPLNRRIALPDMVAYGAATWDWHRLHYDPAHALRLGAPAPLVDGQMLGALLVECVLRCAGPAARLTRLAYRNRAPVRAGEAVSCSGTIATVDDAGFSVDMAVTVGDRLVVAPAYAQLAWSSS